MKNKGLSWNLCSGRVKSSFCGYDVSMSSVRGSSNLQLRASVGRIGVCDELRSAAVACVQVWGKCVFRSLGFEPTLQYDMCVLQNPSDLTTISRSERKHIYKRTAIDTYKIGWPATFRVRSVLALAPWVPSPFLSPR